MQVVGMTDVLYIIAITTFVVVMFGFMFLYGQRPERPKFDTPGRAGTSGECDARRSIVGRPEPSAPLTTDPPSR